MTTAGDVPIDAQRNPHRDAHRDARGGETVVIDADGMAAEAERNSSLMIGLLHFLVVFAAPALLWNAAVVDRRNLVAWTAAEALLGVISLGASWAIRRNQVERFVRLSRIESAGTAATFSALAWLGTDIASATPSKHVLMIALIAVTSISAANSSHITRRRPFFAKLIVIVATSYSLAFTTSGEFIFATLTIVWCVSIAMLTRVGYHGMVELLELRQASEKTARHDDLTGLLSRNALFDALATATEAAGTRDPSGPEPVLVLFDLDGFKAINDSFGHAAGDAVLRTVGTRLGRLLPEGAAIGRLGGDEFAAIFAAPVPSLAKTVDQALIALSEPIHIDGRELYVAASAGWTAIEDNTRPAELMAQADAAMYQSKKSETDVSTGFDSNLRSELTRSLELRQRFRTALKRDEIEFWAQPLVRTSDKAPVAVELLARWPQADATFVDPSEFTRVADETGLAVELDRQALSAAHRVLEAWSKDPLLQSMIVKANISPVHLHNDQLIQSVHELIPGHLRERLGIEFVESRLIPAAERNHDQLRELRAMGITVSIDDFGVGYSSLAYLRELPVSEIKIDRSFVTGVDTDRINQGLVRAIVNISSTLGFPTVAEGIETQAEFEAVQRLGVSLAQGYLLGRPCPLPDATRLLHHMHSTANAAQIEPGRPTGLAEGQPDPGSHTPGQLRSPR